MDISAKSSLDLLALSMMSKTYFFELLDPIHSMFKNIGSARVIAVVINESTSPELLIESVESKDHEPEFYSIDDLSFSPSLLTST